MRYETIDIGKWPQGPTGPTGSQGKPGFQPIFLFFLMVNILIFQSLAYKIANINEAKLEKILS